MKPNHTRELVRRFNSELTFREIDGEHDIIDRDRCDWAALSEAVQTFVRHSETAAVS
ncbi:hypothetical protein HC928_18770 [bacterium]|nr:hypothetical protein [bacterium]